MPFTASNGTPPYVWSVTAGALPDGLSLSNSTGLLSGIPTRAGSASFTVRCTGLDGLFAESGYNLTIAASAWEAWQFLYFGSTTSALAAPDADPFGKGISNTNQFLLGLNPTNPQSVFRMVSATATGGCVVLVWKAAGVRTNVVQAAGSVSATNFADISGPIGINVQGDTATNYTDLVGTAEATSRFYRVRLW